MVNFTFQPTRLNAIITKPRKVLAVGWSPTRGLVVALRNGTRKDGLTKFTDDNRMDLETLIRISAQRGGIYAR